MRPRLLPSVVSVALGVALPLGGAVVPLTPALASTPGSPAVSVELALRPTAGARAAVVAFARAHGLTVLSADAHQVVLRGPADGTAALFRTSMRRVAAPRAVGVASTGGAASTGRPQVPAGLGSAVRAVAGLDDRPLFHPQVVPAGLTGPDLRAAYGVPTTGAGVGITVATVQFSGFDPADVQTYAAAAGIPLQPGQVTPVSVAGASPSAVVGDGDIEVDSDVEAILAVAPQARQRVYVAPNTLAGAAAAYRQIAADAAAGLVQVASVSWGSCEADLGATALGELTDPVASVAAAGATLFAASGDTGAYDCSTPDAPDNRASVDFPASSPAVVGVGGTTLQPTSSGWAQQAWSVPGSPDPSAFQGNGSGGGISSVFARPAWQPAGAGRVVPDVAAVASPESGLGVYAGGWQVIGGTSVAAPVWAGGLAAALSAAGRHTGLGDIHAALYAHPGAFTDITTGSNGAYAAGAGDDPVTGLGAPDWAALADALGLGGASAPVASSPVSPSPVSSAPVPSPVSSAPTSSPVSSAPPTASPSGGAPSVTRLAGANRMATAVAVSQAAHPQDHSAATVVLARADTYPDALAGVPLAAALDAPLLLSLPAGLDAATLAEIQRVLAPAGTVDLLGGPTSLSPAVADRLSTAGYTVDRIAGADRFATGALVADRVPHPTVALLADGTGFADALSAGAAAARAGGVVLLTQGGRLPAASREWLAEHAGISTYAVGGAAAAARPIATPLAGPDRYATALLVARQFFPGATTAGVASGLAFPDALAAGPWLAAQGAPLLLTAPGGLSRGVASYLSGLHSAELFGGRPTLPDSLLASVTAALG